MTMTENDLDFLDGYNDYETTDISEELDLGNPRALFYVPLPRTKDYRKVTITAYEQGDYVAAWENLRCKEVNQVLFSSLGYGDWEAIVYDGDLSISMEKYIVKKLNQIEKEGLPE